MSDKIEIYREAFEAGREAFERAKQIGRPKRANEDPLEIIFYGMVCFDPLEDRPGYRVLFPNGLDNDGVVPLHLAAVSVRDRAQPAGAQWRWLALENDFVLGEKRGLVTITGLAPSEFNDDDMNGRLTTLRAIDPTFTISDTPNAVMELVVDQGILSAHFVNTEGMIVVRWQVQRAKGQAVRFLFGDDTYIEIPATATQVMLVNAGRDLAGDTSNHFRLFRRLTDDPKADLDFRLPQGPLAPLGAIALKDPTLAYGTLLPVGKTVNLADLVTLDTPNVVCSSVQLKPREPIAPSA
jgi:hypothetical protein